MSTNVLITGASRGLGKGLLERYLQLPNHIVIAANRNPSHPASKDLFKLPIDKSSRLILVKLDANVWQDAIDAVKALENLGIDRLDIVIANAGVSYIWPSVLEVKEKDIDAHMRPNAYGVVGLYQAIRNLLRKSEREPIFASVGSSAGSVASPIPFTNAAYGPSKAAAAWYTMKINMEEPWLNAFGLNPGWVHTELGDTGAIGLGVDKATQDVLMISLEESCDGMMRVLAKSTKAVDGGKLVVWTGETTPW